ncbi:13157_t:CDS:1, partial [Entrophospora sp. SA101]
MSQEGAEIFQTICKLQEPIPQYVLGLIPVVTTLGTSPFGSLIHKLSWIFRCLGCPFTALFYYLNIKDDPVEMCIYWLPAKSFITTDKKILDFRPVGLHVKDMIITSTQKKIIENCTATASVLDRLSSLASAYYITVGIIAGISGVVGPCTLEDWPFLTLLFLWTFGVIMKRTFGTGIVVVKDPEIELEGRLIRALEENEDIKAIQNEFTERGEEFTIRRFDKNPLHIKFMFTFTALSSMALSWVSVGMAYYTPPIGFFCRSKFLA